MTIITCITLHLDTFWHLDIFPKASPIYCKKHLTLVPLSNFLLILKHFSFTEFMNMASEIAIAHNYTYSSYTTSEKPFNRKNHNPYQFLDTAY